MNIASNTVTIESVHGLKQTVVLVPGYQNYSNDQQAAAKSEASAQDRQIDGHQNARPR